MPGWLNEHPTFQLVQKKELPASKESIEIWGNKGGKSHSGEAHTFNVEKVIHC